MESRETIREKNNDAFPLVSVIIPSYNRHPLLTEAVESVLEQTYRNFELIVVDDGSTDGTQDFLRSRRLRCLRMEHCGYPGKVRNCGARAAAGKYLAFLDSDDIWVPEKLERQVSLMAENPDCRISHTAERWMRRGREISQKGQRHKRRGMIFPDALKKCIIGPSTVLMERSLFTKLGGFREDLEIAEDYELWLRLCCAEEVCYLDEPLTVKRAGYEKNLNCIAGQLSEKYGHIEYFRLIALKDLVESGYFLGPNCNPYYADRAELLARRELGRKAVIFAAGARKRGREEEARDFERLAEKMAGKA